MRQQSENSSKVFRYVAALMNVNCLKAIKYVLLMTCSGLYTNMPADKNNTWKLKKNL